MADNYQVGKRPKRKGRRVIIKLIITLLFLGLIAIAVVIILQKLKPKTAIKQSKPIVSHVNYDSKSRTYDEGDFKVDLPVSWHPLPRPPGPYKSFSWQSSETTTNGQVIEIYEDTIPSNFAVNRVLIVNGENDHVVQKGSISDNCSQYTAGLSTTPYQVGAPAKWQDINFLCDQANQARDIIGTSSTDGINTVILESQNSGASHKFFFTFTNYNAANPDYSAFYSSISSLRMQ